MIKELKDCTDLSAKFVCTIAFSDLNNKLSPIVTTGKCNGEIILKRRGSSGFGYDPIFYMKKMNKTFAELSEKEKNLVSHRAMAVKDLIKRINI